MLESPRCYFADWLKASEALVVLGTLAGVVATVTVFLCAFVDYVGRNKISHVMTMLANFAAGKCTCTISNKIFHVMTVC